jgi:predicted aspartyl protease
MTERIYTTLQIDTPTKRQKIKPWIDTGFDKYLILPEKIAEKIRLKIVKRVPVGLGNGKFSYGAVGEAILSISITGVSIEIEAEVLVLPNEVEPIIGIGLLALIHQKTSYSPLLDFKTGQLVFLAV